MIRVILFLQVLFFFTVGTLIDARIQQAKMDAVAKVVVYVPLKDLSNMEI